MPKRAARKARAAPSARQRESKHEHWVKKSAIVAIIASVITFLGGFSLLVYTSGHITPIRASMSSAPFWIAAVTLIVIALLVDYLRTNLKKVYWIEDIVGGVFGALGYAVFFAVLGIGVFTTPAGFVVGTIILGFLFYLGFLSGNAIDTALKEAGVDIN